MSTRPGAVVNTQPRDWNRFAGVTMALTIMYISIVTMASGQWTVQKTSTTVRLSTSVSYSRTIDVGFWQLCNCTSITDSGYFCNSQQGQAIAHAFFSVACAVLLLAALVVICVDAFVLVDEPPPASGSTKTKSSIPDWLRADHVAGVLYGFAAVFATISWILPAVRYAAPSASPCRTTAPFLGIDVDLGVQSFKSAGRVLHWAFGIRVAESVFITALAVIFALRATGKIRGAWHVAFVIGVVAPVFTIITTSANTWIAPSTTSLQNRNIGPWGECDCFAVETYCDDLSSNYRAVQAFAVIRLVLQVVQMMLLGLVLPLAGAHVPRIVSVITPWTVWATHLLVWTISIGTFSQCGCNGIHAGQSLSWPFAFDISAFFIQTVLGVHLSWRFMRQRLLQWALDNNTTAGFALPPTATQPAAEPDAYDPYMDAGSPGGSSAAVAPSPSPSRFSARRRTNADNGAEMAPRVARSRFNASSSTLREPVSSQ